jgi:carbamoyl-phosphate synthase small subunit
VSSPQLLPDHAQALLALADGTVFMGRSIGATGRTTGEVVFNTALTGYQEILTDPSYCRQIVTLTYPHIGSYGTSTEDVESARVFAAGLVVKDVPARESNFRSGASLGDYLRGENTVGIAGIDTRRLTRLLRSGGAQNGCIVALAQGEAITPAIVDDAVAQARATPSMAGLDLAKVVSVREPYEWKETTWALGSGYGAVKAPRWHVVAYDFGVKFNILRMLAARGCRITVVPAETPAADVLAHRPDGVFLANGPGDPEPCDYAIAATRELVGRGVPTFGICLGHQIMALAAGARTYKMKFGHHGANHPVKDLDSGRVSITSQNHGFAVDPKSLPATLRATHVSLFDGTLQGLAHIDKPAFCFQGHPEASPGPHDIGYLFDRFVAMMESAAAPVSAAATQATGSAHA